MDDVIITSPSFNEHLDNLNQVLKFLRDAGLTLNNDKCQFTHDKLKYLGLIISKDGIKTDDNKVKAITEMKPPQNNKEVSKFLGMAGWYQKFIPNYADICEPLYRITVNIDQVRVYHARHSDTNSFDCTNETLYEGKRSSNGSSRSHPGKSRRSRKPSGDERTRDKFRSIPTTTVDEVQSNKRREQARIKSTLSDKARKTMTTGSKGHSAAEGRPVHSRKTTRELLEGARRNTKGAEEHCDRQSTAEQPQEKEPQYGSLRRRSA
ncbi:retrovirus-related Pol polyprotein from transposon 297 [Trichonephila clavipes]|nr:retrovirus-related Pol polyprotein from transposon 297 [Trichonephila clavipes]